MEKTKKVKHFKSEPGSLFKKPATQEKTKAPSTDQQPDGSKQLYDDRKIRSSNHDNSTITKKEKAERKAQHAREKAETLKNLTKKNQ